jgi:hypothetical protein
MAHFTSPLGSSEQSIIGREFPDRSTGLIFATLRRNPSTVKRT